MPKRVLNDLTGKTSGCWKILGRASNYVCKSGVTRIRYRCVCIHCGREKYIGYSQLVKAATQRCKACASYIHALRKENPKLEREWIRVRSICAITRRRNKRKKRLGCLLRPKLHPEWAVSFQDFIEGVGRPPDDGNQYLLRPIDTSRGFVPGNTIWLEKQKAMNDGSRKGQVFITINGETHTMAEWARREGVSRQAIEIRIRRGKWRNIAKVVKVK